jgi:hypothetical protein
VKLAAFKAGIQEEEREERKRTRLWAVVQQAVQFVNSSVSLNQWSCFVGCFAWSSALHVYVWSAGKSRAPVCLLTASRNVFLKSAHPDEIRETNSEPNSFLDHVIVTQHQFVSMPNIKD